MDDCWKARIAVALAILMVSQGANAQASGSSVISVGWVHIAPQSGSDPLHITRIGGASADQTISGSSSGIRSSNTAGITFERYFTNHIGVALIGGWPGMVQFEGRGTLGGYGVLGEARVWAPEVVMRYHFGEPQDRFRPFVGLGVSYMRFTSVRVTNNDFVKGNFGPGGSATASVSSTWDPAFHVGFDYRLSKHWAAGASLIYVPAASKVTLVGRTADGTEISSETKIRLRPVITMLNVSYTF
ncbi:OmpW/AlkL family protein [Burkholderia anthina]|uniref:OmpW/AlkL family protein n=1 Tax=Burkholderia anthina TaxID=179879 RepID=UPI00158BD507|nr:OmpW family outer membrane protein [Burkholderia anthina]